ncbi:MAG: nitroreductase family protein [Dehalococcoidales bacterium]
MLKDLIIKNRSTRRYYQDVPVSRETLMELIELARFSPSGGNRQLLKYFLSSDPKINDIIYNQISLGGNPPEGERPAAYIIIINDTQLGTYGATEVDHGIAAQSILLGAVEKGLGGCMVGMVNRKELRKVLNIPERYEILLVLTIGKPKESFVFEPVDPNTENVRGWWDEQGVRHIPKRTLEDLIIG